MKPCGVVVGPSRFHLPRRNAAMLQIAMRPRKHRPTALAAPVATSGAAVTSPWVWLYGRHPVIAAIGNPCRRLDRLLATAENAAALEQVTASASRSRPPVETVDRRTIEALLPPEAVHQGFAALARPLPTNDLDAVVAAVRGTSTALVIVLDQVTDPRNVGAVLRSAAAFGADALVLQARHAPEESGALAKAASGALEAVALVRVVNLTRALRSLKDAAFCCVGLAGDAPLRLADAPLVGRVVLVLGAEGSGLRRLVRETCDVVVRIPIAGIVDSLNVSVAAGIALYECRRVAPPTGNGSAC